MDFIFGVSIDGKFYEIHCVGNTLTEYIEDAMIYPQLTDYVHEIFDETQQKMIKKIIIKKYNRLKEIK